MGPYEIFIFGKIGYFLLLSVESFNILLKSCDVVSSSEDVNLLLRTFEVFWDLWVVGGNNESSY